MKVGLSVETVEPLTSKSLKGQVLISIEEFECSLPQARSRLERDGGIRMLIFGLKLPQISHVG